MSRNTQNVSDPANTDETDVPDLSVETDISATDAGTEDNSDTSDEATVSVTKDNVAELDFSDDTAIQAVYGQTDRAGKAAIRAHLTKLQEKAVMVDSDIVAAKRLFDLNGSLKTIPAKSDKTVDLNQIVANRAVVLHFALNRLLSGKVLNVPEGVELDTSVIGDLFANSVALDWTDETDKAVTALQSVKWGNANKNDVAAHIAEWAQSVPTGTFGKISTIARFRSNEYGTDKPSDGAVAAHLFGNGEKAHNGSKYDKSDLSGVVPVEANATTARGARTI